MEHALLVLTVLIAALVVLDLAAWRFGADTRDHLPGLRDR